MTNNHRNFTENCHVQGKWNTFILVKNRFIRSTLMNFCSFKRKGVYTLSLLSKADARALDLGAGNGAYAHWFLNTKSVYQLIAVDWSFTALKKIPSISGRPIVRVCADLHNLPFKSASFDTLFSIDTFGHVENLRQVLKEIHRIAKPQSQMFFHSECKDYQSRWPDRVLIKKIKKDIPAAMDGHFFLKPCTEIFNLYRQKLLVKSFFSPAGLLGWLLGYPEKYFPAFKSAQLYFFTTLTLIFAIIKKIPILNSIILLLNACTNYLELLFDINGGGSCFAYLEKPRHDNVNDKHN